MRLISTVRVWLVKNGIEMGSISPAKMSYRHRTKNQYVVSQRAFGRSGIMRVV
jgi:hypothetical protein